jgi:hypothetical protein
VLDPPERPDDGLCLGQFPRGMSERLPLEAGTDDLQVRGSWLALLGLVLDSFQIIPRDSETFDPLANRIVLGERFP